MAYDFKQIESKWQKKWEEKKVFEANPKKGKKKFFLTFPYPYVNLSPHIGHFYTIMRVEAFARYKKLLGLNVLFPQGWHATGSPIVAAANRVKENEPKQIELLKKEGFSEKEIKEFSEPEHWIKIFGEKWREDLKRMGLSIDWRRNFFTTSLNPRYDKFVKWQFKKLKEKKLIAKGKHPVVWDPKTNMPVGDHDRIKGEGEVPQEFTLLKFKFGKEFLVAATLRPETIFGQTNLWVKEDLDYLKARVGDETWVVSKECIEKLKQQERKVSVIGKVKGKELIGKMAIAPGIKRGLMILPSKFVNSGIGTGIVTSVPSDAPYDYVALRELQENKELDKLYGFNLDLIEQIEDIEIIPIIKTEKYGNKAAVKIVENSKIILQDDPRLERLTQEIYKEGYYKGIMLETCGDYKGMKVIDAKEKIKKALLKKKEAEIFYELTGEVVSRSLTKCIVKIVSDQWFIKYGNKKWKKQVSDALKNVRLYPEIVREQFSHVIGWINDWACTREYGLGTKLPFDDKWLIESLSDSTIYMAYYTIAHKIKKIPANEIDDKFFDYIFLGKGSNKKLKDLKDEFEYWYPLDFRNSGKDLVQNHLTFFLFNHVAIFPKKYWPRSIGVNGWVRVNGEKMSKSIGNVISLREMAEKFGADVSRMTILNGGENLEDPNWDSSFADSLSDKIESVSEMILKNYKGGAKEIRNIDGWAESVLNRNIKEATEFMEATLFRSAIQRIFFNLSGLIKNYLSRTQNNPNKKVFEKIVNSYLIMLSPFCPHFAEEIWEKLGNKNFISLSKWPKCDVKKISEEFERQGQQIEKVIEDINKVANLLRDKKKKISKVFIYVLPKEKRNYAEQINAIAKKVRLEAKIYSVDEKDKHDPENKSKKVRPGRPGIYLE